MFRKLLRRLFDRWQQGGVIFLNAGLTLSRFAPQVQRAHLALWRPVVGRLLQHLATRKRRRVVFLLWGAQAQRTFRDLGIQDAAEAAGTGDRVAIATHAHPAAETPSGRPRFFAAPNPFTDANDQLVQAGGHAIAW